MSVRGELGKEGAEHKGELAMYNGGGFMEFLVGIIIFALDVWAIFDIWTHPRTTGAKILWTLLVLLFPVVGLLIYVLLGRGRLASTR